MLALKRKEYVIVKKTLKAISVINVNQVIGVILHVMVNINILPSLHKISVKQTKKTGHFTTNIFHFSL